jgi:hypothetical protein
MEAPYRIDFQSNGRVIFYVNTNNKEQRFVGAINDSFEANDTQIIIGLQQFATNLITSVYKDGVLTGTYTEVSAFDYDACVTKNQNIFLVFAENMSLAPAAINVDAPVTIEAANAEILGYAILNVTAAAVVDLSDGVDDSSAPVPIPADATGARLVVQFTSTDAKLLFAANGSTPANTPSERGEYVVENKTEIFLGRTPQSSDAASELQAFKAIMNTAKTATILITYYKMS